MNYKTLLIADVHLRDTDIVSKTTKNGWNIRTSDKLTYLQKTVQYAIKNNMDSVIINGDLFHNTRPSNKLKNATSKILSILVRNEITVYLIGGNHDTTDGDYYNMMSESNFSKYIKFTSNHHIETKTGYSLHLLSWNNRHELSPDKNTLLISHLQMEEADYGNERLAKHGTPLENIKSYHKAYLGHLHKRQVTKNYIYIGSLAINNFGERDNKTGFLTLNINQNGIKEKFINISDRKFISKKIEAKNQSEIYKKLEDEIIDNSILSLTVTLPKEAHINRKEVKDWLYKEKNVFIVTPVKYKRDMELMEKSIKVGITDKKAFNEFVKDKNVNDFYKKIGQKIIQKVNDEN